MTKLGEELPPEHTDRRVRTYVQYNPFRISVVFVAAFLIAYYSKVSGTASCRFVNMNRRGRAAFGGPTPPPAIKHSELMILIFPYRALRS